jgi:hypothetical protein
MWVFLSSRIRTWLLMAVAVPLLARVVSRLAAGARLRDPGGAAAKWLTRLETALLRVSRRKRRRRRG